MKKYDLNSIGVDTFSLPVAEVPSSDALKARILKETENMAQDVGESVEYQAKITSLGSLFQTKFAAPLALAASVALMAVLWMPASNNIINHQDEVALTFEELTFEEFLLLSDDLMFAQL